MSAGFIRVTPEELRNLMGQLNSQASEIQNSLGSIKSQVEGIASTWQGMASGDFSQLMERWSRDAIDLHDVLTQIAANLGQAAQAYEESEQGIARGFNIS